MQITSTRRVVAEPGGDQVAVHVGLHALGAFADQLGLGSALSARVPTRAKRPPMHDRGKVLVHQMLVLAGGGESCADIEYLRAEDDLFSDVCSDSTLYRTFTENLDEQTMAEVKAGFAEVRQVVWRRAGLIKGNDPMVFDIDASLIDVHSEHKEGTAPNYKYGFGFHPMFCTADATGEVLSALLRPGNATANCVDDHLVVLDEALAQLPGQLRCGHGVGDDLEAVRRGVVVRADSAGATQGFVWGCRKRHVGFAVAARETPRSQPQSRRSPATSAAGSPRFAKTAGTAWVPRWQRSPTSSTCASGRRAPGSSSGASHCTRAPKRVCSRASSTATGATTPTSEALRRAETCSCAATPTSKTPSDG